MATHTPGPWQVGPVDDTVVTHVGLDGRRFEIASVDGDYNQLDTWPVMEANARLIAAAPEMLAALKQVCAWKDAITLHAPELGGLLIAIYHAEAVATKAEA